MLKAIINIEATTWEEIEFALQEVMKNVGQQYFMVQNEREDGITKFDYHIVGDESPFIECENCNATNYYEDNVPNTCYDCGKAL